MKKYNAFSLPLLHLLVDEKATLAKAEHVYFENCHAELRLWFSKHLGKCFFIFVCFHCIHGATQACKDLDSVAQKVFRMLQFL